MILADVDIRKMIEEGLIAIDPFDDRLLKRNSYLLRLADLFRVVKNDSVIDIADPSCFDQETSSLVSADSIVIHPDSFVLGCSLEKIAVPSNVVGIISGISNIARLGVQIHTTSYVINAGYGQGNPSRITFELSTVGSMKVKLHYNIPVCHLIFLQMTSSTSYAVASARTGQSGPELSDLYNQFGHFIREGKRKFRRDD